MKADRNLLIGTKHCNSIAKLDMEQKGMLLDLMIKYQLGEELPEVDLATSIIFDYIKSDIDANTKKYNETCERNKKNAKARWNATGCDSVPLDASGMPLDATECDSVPNDADYDNDNDIYKKKSTTKVVLKEKGFTPPTYKEILEYCAEKDLSIDVDKFIDYYSAQGWKLANGNKMKDWKASVRNWARSQRTELTSKDKKVGIDHRDRFCNAPERSYDMADLERRLIV